MARNKYDVDEVLEESFEIVEFISQGDEFAFITAETNEKAFEDIKAELVQKGAQFEAVIRKLL